MTFEAQFSPLLHFPLAGWFICLVLISLCQLLLAVRWWLYLGLLTDRPPWRSALLIYGQSWLFSLTPGRSGEAIRALWLRQRCGIPVAMGLAVLAAERITGLFAGLLLLVIFLSGTAPFIGTLVLALVLGLLLLISHPVMLSQLADSLPHSMNHGLRGFPLRLLGHFLQFLSQSRRLLTLKGILFGVGTALVAWLLESGLLLYLWDSVGSRAGLGAAVVVRVMMGLSGVMSLLPAGLGVGDGTALGLSLLYGLNPDQAFGSILLFRLFSLGYLFVLGFCMLALHRVIGQPMKRAS